MGSFRLQADFREFDGTASTTTEVWVSATTQIIGADGGSIFDDGPVAVTGGVLDVLLPGTDNAPHEFGYIVTRATGRTKLWQVPAQEPDAEVNLSQFTSTTPLPVPPSALTGYTQAAGDETITGAWDFTTAPTIDGEPIGGGAVDSVNGQTGVVVLDAGDVGADPSGTAAGLLATHTGDTTAVHGIADTSVLETTTGAQAKATAAQSAATTAAATDATTKANAAQAFAIQRGNHTGSQTSATISDLTEAVQDILGAALVGSGVTVTYDDAAGSVTITGAGSTDLEAVRDAIGVALVGVGNIGVAVDDAANTITISTTATANSTDAALRDRSTHTGTQAASTITGLAAVATTGAKADVGLGNVDNTSDANKPVSTAQQTALNLKAPIASPTFTGTPAAPTWMPTGLTWATQGTRYVGGTNGLPPISGSFNVGDFVIDQAGKVWVCQVAGGPGYWTPAIGEAFDPFAARHMTRLIAKLTAGVEDAVIVITGDSTGNDTTDWFYRWVQSLAALFPAYTVTHALFSDASKTYAAPTTVQTGSGTKTLTVLNGSVAGMTTAYGVTNFAAQFTSTPDLTVVNYGHNNSASTFTADYATLTDLIASTYPTTGIICSAQNPRTDTTANADFQYRKMAALRQLTQKAGYGFIDVMQAFLNTASWASALISGDGIHPNNTGFIAWRDEWLRYVSQARRTHNASVQAALDLKADLTATFNNQTGTTYTFVLSDAGKVVTGNNASAQTFTVPPNSSVAFPVGTVIELSQLGAGQITLAAGAGVTLNSRGAALKLAGQYAAGAIRKSATDTWLVIGDVTT